MKQKIGIWNDYNVFLHKDKDKIYWTVEDDNKEHNRFESKESFGHWVFHSGFIPIVEEKKVKKSDDLYSDVSTCPIHLLIKASKLTNNQLKRFPTVYKLNISTGKVAVKKTVRGKKKIYQQTYWVSQDVEKIKREDLLLKTVSEEQIQKFKEGKDINLFMKLVEPIIKKHYRDGGLKLVGVDYDDAKVEGQLISYEKMMAYKPFKGGGASLSSMIYQHIWYKFKKMYRKEKVHKEKVQVDRFDSISNTSDLMDMETRADINMAVEGVRDRISKRRDIDTSEYIEMFNEFLQGYSWKDMAVKRGYKSRQVIISKFKRIIYPMIVKEGFSPRELSKESAEKEKYLKKSKENNKGYMFLYKYMSAMLGEEKDVDIDDTGLYGIRANIKLENLKKICSRMSGSKNEKVLYRLINNFDMFTVDFIKFISKYKIKSIKRKGSYGYSVLNDSILIYDNDTLAVTQYNVLISLIDEYIKNNDDIQGYIKDYGDKVHENKLESFNKDYIKKFKHQISTNVLHNYIVINTFLYFIDEMNFKGVDIDRYKKVQKYIDDKFNFIYHRVLEV